MNRTLVIPPELGYGDIGSGRNIPGGATLKFSIELIGMIKKGEKKVRPNIFKEMDTNSDHKISYEEMQNWFTIRKKNIPPLYWEKQDTNQVLIYIYLC